MAQEPYPCYTKTQQNLKSWAIARDYDHNKEGKYTGSCITQLDQVCLLNAAKYFRHRRINRLKYNISAIATVTENDDAETCRRVFPLDWYVPHAKWGINLPPNRDNDGDSWRAGRPPSNKRQLSPFHGDAGRHEWQTNLGSSCSW